MDFGGLSLPQQHFPPAASPAKPSGKMVLLGESKLCKLLLVQGIITNNHPHHAEWGWEWFSTAQCCCQGGEICCWTTGPFWRAAHELLMFPWSQIPSCFTWSCNCSCWHISFWRAIEKSDRVGIWCFQARHSLIFSTASPIRYEHRAGDGLGQTTTQQHCVVSGVQRRAQLPGRRGTRSNKSNWKGLRQY